MTVPIAPDDIEGLAKAAYAPLHEQAWAQPYESRDSASMERYRKVARGVRDALVPLGYTVVRTDDLRAVLDEFGWREMHYATADDFQAIYDRLRGKVGEK